MRESMMRLDRWLIAAKLGSSACFCKRNEPAKLLGSDRRSGHRTEYLLLN
jgi:hypothetical protein